MANAYERLCREDYNEKTTLETTHGTLQDTMVDYIISYSVKSGNSKGTI